MNPKIILIGGAAGTRKTSISKILSEKLDIEHRIGLGFMRETIRCFFTEDELPFLHKYSFRPSNDIGAYKNLLYQSTTLKPPIDDCIDRAKREGTNLIIEGVNLIPRLFDGIGITKYVILTIENEEEHKKSVLGDTHSKRKISKSDMKNIRYIQDKYIEEAKEYGIDIIDSTNVDEAVKQIIKGIK